ncbi:hypothetical protein [Paeniglutamicibacter cryotolerans]|uniref:hypothetical protein n=1 Tax=Paeniglutamicibacter cryotolerans TaxID=670079 RepID=UPI0016215A9A|nr:hypothetical protein [Paeniglutamicibacter cryotolerans]
MNRKAQAHVAHHGGGGLILGGVLAAVLFAIFAVIVSASTGGAMSPLVIGVAFGLICTGFGIVYHFTH